MPHILSYNPKCVYGLVRAPHKLIEQTHGNLPQSETMQV